MRQRDFNRALGQPATDSCTHQPPSPITRRPRSAAPRLPASKSPLRESRLAVPPARPPTSPRPPPSTPKLSSTRSRRPPRSASKIKSTPNTTIRPSHTTLAADLAAAGKQGDAARVIELAQILLERLFAVDDHELRAALHALSHVGSMDLALRCYLAFAPPRYPPNNYDTFVLVRAARKANRNGMATAIYNHVKQHKVTLNASGFVTLLLALSAAKEPMLVRKLYDTYTAHVPALTPPNRTRVIDALAGSGFTDEAYALYRDLRHAEPPQLLDAYVCSALLGACVKFDNRTLFFRIYQEMQTTQIAANTVLYTNLIRAAVTFGQPRRAILLLQEMKRRDIPPSEGTFVTLVDALAKHGHIEMLRYVYTDLQTRPDAIARSPRVLGKLLIHCSRLGIVDLLNPIQETLESTLPDRGALATAPKWDDPNAVATVGAILGTWALQKDDQRVYTLYHRYLREGYQNLSVPALVTAIQVTQHLKIYTETLTLLREALARPTPNLTLAHTVTLIGLFGESRYRSSLDLLDDHFHRVYLSRPDEAVVVLTALMEAYGGRLKDAERVRVYWELWSTGSVPLDSAAVSVLIDVCRYLPESVCPYTTAEVLALANRAALPLNTNNFTSLLEYYGIRNRHAEAIHTLVHMMPAAQVLPDAKLVTNYRHTLVAGNRQKYLVQLHRHLASLGPTYSEMLQAAEAKISDKDGPI
ncbi:hypothetical protein IWQ60_009293 [Tieghemiomyces parasiticus]|uniref:Pentacotripeptide-repeat region of PRORP domain-containing protein n=1 Tax=Tieghemiomyces parasiticus TaxID=78921 RepID=A0A9W8DLD1_9FUNG|nr:hypothetical protein IWQ60_009293 [Tieghemiomyces parasiticus]